ncbi:MAG: hypothetical protein PHH17_03015 [Candidatus Pacebacteria bacterium]|jgi:hypothetical protein|nr:hypothetical protein [Candidatus Paceibacterota bacterium]MDD3072634.1 hypothetical protein [Candidatus Paceibacterota bacterium]MDD3729321.1 hypothetical protein [Candidatus Paceibacterota bacterium]MDD4201676.1 hypothetical protein [Candidatus Paceibacterota bacterium]MDD4467024.1 hypothetical protein [Candidatus Paceibacterota bacterium]
MAIIFQKEKRRQKYLLISLAVLFFVMVVLFSVEFFVRRGVYIYEQSESPIVKEVDIDFELLERARDMRPFERIEPLSGVERRGRGNPFISYESETESDFIDLFNIDLEEEIPLP